MAAARLLAVALSLGLLLLGSGSGGFFVSGAEELRNTSSSSSSPQLSTVLATESKAESAGARWPSVEQELEAARAAIRRAARRRHGDGSNVSSAAPEWFTRDDVDYALLARVYRNPAAFYRSYVEMERRFKVYVYGEGEPPILHAGPCKDIYTIEGRFIEQLELITGGVRTWEPARAHAFFLPFSVAKMVKFAYRPKSNDKSPLLSIVADYVRVVASRHLFWNRSAGADHFMLSCHDWGPEASRGDPELYANGIRALCNANTSEGFRPGKDVSIPEINLYTGDTPRQLLEPAPGLSSRPFLAFFAGGRHGHVRDFLLQHWKGRDPDTFPVYEYDLPSTTGNGTTGKRNTGKGARGPDRQRDYFSYMHRARFCLCPSGHEVASPRVVEAIHAGCVPVLVSDGYAPPFADVLRWEAFSVSVPVADIPRLKEILERIPTAEVERLLDGVRLVKQHFTLRQPPERLDMFHMILHSVWLRRLNFRLNQ
ncbi:probable glycosyltransferase At5g25310 [Lolium rigidum]|uniref:probable glycosyltransferase At5g25310 n=1 Tax=Lolium rigidum TaxID=89674 RepID=UPI001F5D7316|nr:probable glycosyltransferase At5g25310 [Lolium rigidum]